jgi:hypothetical protein
MAKIIEILTFEVEDKYGVSIQVTGRIEKNGNLYYWYTSHLTKPQDIDSVGFYHPSNTESSLESAKKRLNSYIAMMKRSKIIIPNENY